MCALAHTGHVLISVCVEYVFFFGVAISTFGRWLCMLLQLLVVGHRLVGRLISLAPFLAEANGFSCWHTELVKTVLF